MAFDFFGAGPVSVVLSTSTTFNGTAQTGTPQLSPGLVSFPSQAAGGLFNFHKKSLIIKGITFSGTGGADIKITHPLLGATEVVVAQMTSNQSVFNLNIHLPAGASIKIITTSGSGPQVVMITAVEAGPSNSL
jgi:hypothetical protein